MTYAGLGTWGVDVFFVLSGFLITGILLDTRESPDYWRSFYIRRALRIFPLYYVFLMILYLTNPPTGEAWKFWVHLSNWRTDLGISSNVLTWHLWSLAIEEQFYFFWPMVVAILPARGIGLVCLMTAASSVTLRGTAIWWGAGIETLHRMTPLALDGLAIGSYLAWMVRYRPNRAHHLVRLSLPAFLVSTIAISSLGKLNLSFATVMVVGRVLVSLGGGALVFLAVGGPAQVGWILGGRPLRILGQYCYGLYLLHPIIVVKGIGPAHWLATHVPRGLLPFAWVVALVAGLSASFVLAEISWRLVELPCLSLKRLFPYRPASTEVPCRSHMALTLAAKHAQGDAYSAISLATSTGVVSDGL